MSKGLGRTSRAIEAAFADAPDDAYTVEELCFIVYPDIKCVEKKHRVAVLRATQKLWPRIMGIYESRTVVFFTLNTVRSYGMARLKPSCLTNAQILSRLLPGGDQYDAVVEGGVWWRHVEEYRIERDTWLSRRDAEK